MIGLDDLRTALAAGPRPVQLSWYTRQRRRFLHEFHEMKARTPAELLGVRRALVWRGEMPAGDATAEVAICYHPAHPIAAPRVFVLSPPEVAARLPRYLDGSVAVFEPGSWHAGLTAYDAWLYLSKLLRVAGGVR